MDEVEWVEGYTDRCGICKKIYNMGDFLSVKECEKCERIICVETCVAITGCQTTWAICKECFEYKCRKCKADIPREIVYISDFDEFIDLCPTCKKSYDDFFDEKIMGKLYYWNDFNDMSISEINELIKNKLDQNTKS